MSARVDHENRRMPHRAAWARYFNDQALLRKDVKTKVDQPSSCRFRVGSFVVSIEPVGDLGET
jgi:hypothetical protein